MARGSKEAAETRLAKLQAREREAAKVMSEVAAEAKRVDDNTARLKALRLARDAKLADEAAAAAAVKAESRAAVAAAKTKAKAAREAARAAKDAAAKAGAARPARKAAAK